MKEKHYCPFCGQPLQKKFHEGRKRLFCAFCNAPVYENPVPATAVVVADKQKNILLVKRDVEPKKGEWGLPGGFMELDETPEKCAMRELSEETGISGVIETLLGIETSESKTYGTVIVIGFLVTSYTGNPAAGDDASEAAFFTPGNLPPIAFSSHDIFIKRAMELIEKNRFK